MKTLRAALVGACPISSADRYFAEYTYKNALCKVHYLQEIYDDYMAACEEGVRHFEQGLSAWSKLDMDACRAVEEALGYWPGSGAHFEVFFYD